MANAVAWKGIGVVGAAALIAGGVCLVIGARDTASALFVAGIAEIVAGLLLLVVGSRKRKSVP